MHLGCRRPVGRIVRLISSSSANIAAANGDQFDDETFHRHIGVTVASILIVDDEPRIRMLLRHTLGPSHEVEEAADGEEGFEKLMAVQPDILLVDVAMPVVDGLSLCRAARLERSLDRLGIIVISAYATIDEALAAGADRHFRKPFHPLELLRSIEEILAARHVS
jgi:CheY-like chemotaxis protein